MKKLFLALTLVLPLFTPFAVNAAGDADAGKAKAGVCIACHGADGIGLNDIYPNLAGQKQGYIVSSIKAYKEGLRQGGMAMLMTPMVAALSEADINDLAAYYSGLKP